MKAKYIAAVNKLFADRESIIADYEEILKGPLYNTDELEKQKTELEAGMNAAADMAQKEIRKNSASLQDQEEYRKRYEAVVDKFNTVKRKVDQIELEISKRHLTCLRIKQFLESLRKQNALVTEFDPKQFHCLADFITVYSKDDIRVTFRNGMVIKAWSIAIRIIDKKLPHGSFLLSPENQRDIYSCY